MTERLQLLSAVFLSLLIAFLSHRFEASRAVAATVRYSDGEKTVFVETMDEEAESACINGFVDGIAVVRDHVKLREWVLNEADIDRIEREGVDRHDSRIQTLASLLSQIILTKDTSRLANHEFRGQLGSVIPRPHKNGFAAVVHRDLDETAARNLRASPKEPSHRWYNVWIPLSPVKSWPLGLIAPSSVNLSDARGYHESLSDNTGLRFHPSQRWLFFRDLRPGDIVLSGPCASEPILI